MKPADPTTRALIQFLGLPDSATRAVLVLEDGKLARLQVTSTARSPMGSDAKALPKTRSFDLVPTEETRQSFADELAEISLDLSVGDEAVFEATFADWYAIGTRGFIDQMEKKLGGPVSLQAFSIIGGQGPALDPKSGPVIEYQCPVDKALVQTVAELREKLSQKGPA